MYLSYEGAAEGLEGSSKGTVSLDGQETSEMVENTGTMSVHALSECRWRLETGRVTRYRDATVKEGALNRKRTTKAKPSVFMGESTSKDAPAPASCHTCISPLQWFSLYTCTTEHGPL